MSDRKGARVQIDQDLVNEVDKLVDQDEFETRKEAVNTLLRQGLTGHQRDRSACATKAPRIIRRKRLFGLF